MNFNKAPPPFKKEDDFEKWKKKLDIWVKFTNMEKKKQGGALFLSLDEETQDSVLQLNVDTIASESGVTEIVKILDGLYLKDKTQMHLEALDAWEDYKKDDETSVQDFINEYDRRYNKLKAKGSSVSDDVLANKLLRAANLSNAKRQLVKATVGSPLTYEKMKSQLKVVFSEDVKGDLEDIKVEGDTFYADTFQRGRYIPQGQRRSMRARGPYRGIGARSSSQGRGTNPLDQYGRVTTCVNCGSRFHWVNKCPEKNDTAKATYLSAEYPEHDVYEEECDEEEVYHSVTLYQSDYDSPKNVKALVYESLNSAVIDCGASRTVCGRIWLECYTESLDEEWRKQIKYTSSNNIFKFGDGRHVKSSGCVYIPAVIGKEVVRIKTDIVEDDIPLLLSKESLKKAKAELNFNQDTINILGQKLKMLETTSGHYVLPITKDKAVLEACNRNVDVRFVLVCKNVLTPKQKALKLHRQFAHPSAEKLLKLVQNAGGSDKELEDQIKQVSKDCKICQEYNRPPPRPVVGLSLGHEFNDCVAMDLKKYGEYHLFHMIDHVTRLSACAVIKDKKPETIIKELFRIWIGVYGTPKRFLSDNGGEFSNGKFRELCEKLNVRVHTTAAESPWSNGLCERHNAVIADMVTKVKDDTGCSLDLAVNWSVNAKNSLSNVHGFSPYQLVFGKNPKLPNVLADKPPALYSETTHDIIRTNLNALHNARQAFIKSESSEKIRRALRHNIRSSGDVKYVTGDRVYYKRLREKRWKGPATVLGQDGQQVLIKHGGVYVRVHPCRLALEGNPIRKTVHVQNNLKQTHKNRKHGTEENQISRSQYDTSDSEEDRDENRPNTEGSRSNQNFQDTQETVVQEADIQNSESGENAEEDNSHTTEATNSRSRINEVETGPVVSSEPKVKRDMKIKYKKPGSETWIEVKTKSRAGKATGQYKNAWNVVNEEAQEWNVDLDRDVTAWEIVPNETQDVTVNQNSESTTNEDEIFEMRESPSEVNLSEIFTVGTKEETLKAKLNEIESWRRHHVFEEVRDEGQNCVSVRWVITPKIINGEMSVKARLVARGFEETCDFRTDSPTCLRESIRIVIGIIVANKWKLHSIDYKTAFLQGNGIERDVFLKPPTEFRAKNTVWKLKKTVYGLADAPRVWFLRLEEELHKLGAQSSSFDKGVFFWHSGNGLEGIMASFVDDQLWGGTENFEKNVIERLRKTFDISYEHDSIFKYVGVELSQQTDGTIHVNQEKYIEALAPIEIDKDRKQLKEEDLTAFEKRQFRGLVGQLNWVMGMTRPDIAFEVCQLSTTLNKPTIKEILRANKVVRYLKGMSTRIKIPNIGNLNECEVVCYTDASWANLPCGGSQGGFVVFITNPKVSPISAMPIVWKSKKVKRVVRSSIAAETLSFVDGCESAFLVQKMLNEILSHSESKAVVAKTVDSCESASLVQKMLNEIRSHSESKPVVAKTDNKSLFDASQTVKVLTDVRLRVEMGIVRDMIEKKEVKIKWIESGEQLADVLTKAGASSSKLLEVIEKGKL